MDEKQLHDLFGGVVNAGSMAAIAWYLLHTFRKSIDEIKHQIEVLNGNMATVLERMRDVGGCSERIVRLESVSERLKRMPERTADNGGDERP